MNIFKITVDVQVYNQGTSCPIFILVWRQNVRVIIVKEQIYSFWHLKKSSIFCFKANIFLVPNPKAIYWGDKSLLNADITCMKLLLDQRQQKINPSNNFKFKFYFLPIQNDNYRFSSFFYLVTNNLSCLRYQIMEILFEFGWNSDATN